MCQVRDMAMNQQAQSRSLMGQMPPLGSSGSCSPIRLVVIVLSPHEAMLPGAWGRCGLHHCCISRAQAPGYSLWWRLALHCRGEGQSPGFGPPDTSSNPKL